MKNCKPKYQEEDLLLLSGIQHIAFCERQWALIHVEKQWMENIHTFEGQVLHERVDDPYFKEIRKDRVTARSIPVVSYHLGLYGIADVIEFVRVDDPGNSVALPKRKGFWFPNIVEYKRGKPKKDDCDNVQLCAQAICIEEMFNIKLEKGSIYYGKIRHREQVSFDSDLRQKTEDLAKLMHKLFDEGITPKAKYKKACRSCSLFDICIPKMPKSRVKNYLQEFLEKENQ